MCNLRQILRILICGYLLLLQLIMALNLKILGIRSLSAVVFVIVLLGSVLWNYYSFTIFFFIVSLIGLNEFYKISEKLGAKPFKMVGYSLASILYISFLNFDYLALVFKNAELYKNVIVIIFPFILLIIALFSKNEKPINDLLYTVVGIFYAVIPFALLHQFVIFKSEIINDYQPLILIGIIFLIWSNDTFAYLGGSLFGKHKLIERISPGKTWEGTIFGILVTFAISFLIKFYLIKTSGNLWPMLGIGVPILATIGDLVESMLKRQAGIKDSGNIMPGHGGVLDRFDSLIFVSPFVYVIFRLV